MTSLRKLNNTAVKGTEVFVGGLPLTVTENQIHEVFSPCGELVEIRLIKDQKGNLKGFCFVRFASKEAAEKAVKEKNGTMLDGKKIGVLPSMEQNTLYFGNLNKGWSADEFEGIVRQVFPDVVSVDLAMPVGSVETQAGKKQLNRGFAFVKFSSHAAASRAHRVGSKQDFTLGGKLHPSIQWAEEGSEVDPTVMAKIKIAFIRNLPTNADENYLKELFEPFGEIEKVVLWRKGTSPVGFVHFAKRTDLDIAIKEMNMKAVQGPNGGLTHNLSVEVARPMEKNKKRGREDLESKLPENNSSKASESSTSAYSAGHMSIIPPTAVQKDINYVNPYEAAVAALPGIVKERLLRILRLGIATRSDIDIQTLTSLKELPESTAISVLDQFMLSGADTKEKGIYLAGLIFRHQIDKQGRNALSGSLSRLTDVTERHIALSTLSGRALMRADLAGPAHIGSTFNGHDDRIHLPPVHTITPAVGPLATRSVNYEAHSTAAFPDYPLLTRTSLGRQTELSYSPMQDTSSSSIIRSRLNLSPEIYATVEYQDRLKLNTQVSAASGLRGRPKLAPQVAATDEYHPTPQVRFDPFTGEPYKFDPFTGEPIVPDKLARRL